MTPVSAQTSEDAGLHVTIGISRSILLYEGREGVQVIDDEAVESIERFFAI